MAILLVNVKLRDGVDQNSFVSEFDSVSEVTVKNLLPNIPNLVVFNVEESYLSTLKSHPSVDFAEEEETAFPAVTYPSLPSVYTISNKTVSSNSFIGINGSKDGTDYISYQHYLDTDIMQGLGNHKVGNADSSIYTKIGLKSWTHTHNAPILFTQALDDSTGNYNQPQWLQDYYDDIVAIPSNATATLTTVATGGHNAFVNSNADGATLQAAIRNFVGSTNPSGTITNSQIGIAPSAGQTYTVDGTSYPVMGKLYVPTGLASSQIDVVVVFHGTQSDGASGDTIATAAFNMLDRFVDNTVTDLNIRDKIVFSVAYPQDNISNARNLSVSGTGTETSTFLMGDNLPYARAAVGWVKNSLNSFMSSNSISKTIGDVYLFGHSQGGKLVSKINTLDTGIAGVIANAPGPIEFELTCSVAGGYSCNKIAAIHGTATAIGRSTYDEITSYPSQTYSSRYTGKYVDIVTLEGGYGFTGNTYQGYQDTHPDFDDPDNTGNTRCVPMDWNGCSETYNNQVTANNMFTSHAIGTLSSAGGLNSGFAKKAKFYATYTEEGLATVCNAIIHFHNNKSVNSTTGLKDPTIVIGEFQYLRDTFQGIKVDEIASITDPTGGTTNRPAGTGSHSGSSPYWYQCTSHSSMKGNITVNPSDGTTNNYTINVTASSSSAYTLSGSDRNGTVSGDNQSVTINDGDTLTFSVNASSHPFAIRVSDGGANLTNGVTGQSSTNGDVVLTTSVQAGVWGSDLTPFTSRNIFPYQVQDPDDSSWHWMVTFPDQSQSSVVKTAIDSLYDNGIIFITAAGNNGGTYVKESDSRWSGTYCTTDSSYKSYGITYNNGVASPTNVSGASNWFPFRAYGPHGLNKGIDVAAGQNSETLGMIEGYSNRGPGIDIVGRGTNTFCAKPTNTDTNGKQWGDFSGTSCAAPTVAGKAACMMEEYYTLHGAWPNFAQVKNMLQTEARNGNNRIIDPESTTWSNVPAASSSSIEIKSQSAYPNADALLRIQSSGTSGNGGFQFAELAGTPKFFAFLDTRGYSREQTNGRRPTSGVMYPRPRNVSDVE